MLKICLFNVLVILALLFVALPGGQATQARAAAPRIAPATSMGTKVLKVGQKGTALIQVDAAADVNAAAASLSKPFLLLRRRWN